MRGYLMYGLACVFLVGAIFGHLLTMVVLLASGKLPA